MAEASSGETKAEFEVMTHFDKDASGFNFERTASGYRLRNRLVRGLFFKKYRRGAIALDLGCGTGEYTLSLAQAGFDVVGGDLSKGMLTVAKSKVQEDKFAEKIQLIRLESTKLPFRNEAFDTITCIAVLDWVPDSHRLLVEAHRVLKHQATFIACLDSLWSPSRIHTNVQFAISRRRKKHARISNCIELKRSLTACDFIIEKFFGDVLLAQVMTRLLYEPKGKVSADKVLKATQPLDSHLTHLPLFKSLSEHYIIDARKK